MCPFRRKGKSREEVIKKAFSKYLDEENLDSILSGQKDMTPGIKHIDFILILVGEDSNQPQTIGKVLDTIHKHHGMIESITSTLITVYFGVPLEQPNSKQVRLNLVNDLSESFGGGLAIIHGECECFVGNVGSERRMAYTALLPEYKAKLRELSSLEFGQVKEV